MKRIAVVEDNPDNRLLVQAILAADYEIVEYEDGQLALDGLTADPVDLVLLDISLPGLDGEQVLERMRADVGLQAIPVIALTAHAMAGDREKYLASGFDGYVSKPIVDDELLREAIETALGSS